MKELNDWLKSPFDGLKQDDVAGIQNRCFKIAKTLFENYCIACGDKIYRFAEIEFYYYRKEESASEKTAGGCCWNIEEIYGLPAPTEKYEAGETCAYPGKISAWLDYNVCSLRDGLHLQAAERCLMGAISFEFVSMFQRCRDQA